MKSSTHLDSIVFQLTPTRTRYDLVISAKGKTEKIASGLLVPFLSHLKTAQEQIDKGGYSLLLQPRSDSDTTWFTKGTVERFVRFVSTPEIIERVYSLESEILQLEKAIVIQCNNDVGLATVEDHQAKSVQNKEGIKGITDANNEKAIVLYKPEDHPPETNGSTAEHGNSKVQLLKVLETRKTVLQKEQGMAFARAVVAGFDIDHMAPLLSFAECFKATRLMEACLRFVDLWKQKHETGQWVEVEAAEAMSTPHDFSATNASGIVLSSMADHHVDLALENNGKTELDSSIDPQTQAGQQGYYQGQFPYPMFPTWPAHSPPGALPVYPPYPMQGMPFYQPHLGSGPYYWPPHPMEDSGHSNSHRGRRRRHSVDGSDSNSETEELVSETGASHTRRSRKKAGKSVKKQPGVVVIRNINYVASKGENSSDSESKAASDSENDEALKRKRNNTKSMDETNSSVEEPTFGKESGGHWEAFQSFLLRDSDEKSRGDDQNLFGLEKNTKNKRRLNRSGDDPLADGRQEPIEAQNGRISELDKISGNATRMLRPSNDERLISRGDGKQMDNQMDLQYTETNGRKLAYRNNANDEFMTVTREGQSYASHSADPLSLNVSCSHGSINGTSQDMTDESFIIPFRSMSVDQGRTGERIAIDMDSELPSAIQKSEDNKAGHQVNYEPDYLSSMPERGTEKGLMGYDPASEYEMRVHLGDSATDSQKKLTVTDAKQLKKSKTTPDSLGKKKTVGPIRRGKPSKSSPLEDARARAEKLRSYKADLQKLKKEKEEEQQKRLEALKIERQKRIAARGGSTATSSSSQQTKRQLPTRTSLSSQRGSKFTDTEPGSSSPLQRSKLRTVSLGTPESQKTSKTTKSTNDIQTPGNRLIKSVSSLSEVRKETKEVTPDTKASMARIRKLSEPKATGTFSVTSVKTRTPPVSKLKVSREPESKKIAAIIDLDKSKAATLPELKIKTSKGSLEKAQSKSASKETSQNVYKHQNEDDIPVIDKTVVMFEPEKPSAAVPAPSSPTGGVDVGLVSRQSLEQPMPYEVNKTYTDKEPPRTSNAQTAETMYQPPFARLSSVEDPCTRKSEYGKAPAVISETALTKSQNEKAIVSGLSDLKLGKTLETPEKTQSKEAKGFKRLLIFGKKSHNSAAGEQKLESDTTSVNSSGSASSSEVHSLKNLISQDESAYKSSRHFSLLSPFRSKTSEKKSMT